MMPNSFAIVSQFPYMPIMCFAGVWETQRSSNAQVVAVLDESILLNEIEGGKVECQRDRSAIVSLLDDLSGSGACWHRWVYLDCQIGSVRCGRGIAVAISTAARCCRGKIIGFTGVISKGRFELDFLSPKATRGAVLSCGQFRILHPLHRQNMAVRVTFPASNQFQLPLNILGASGNVIRRLQVFKTRHIGSKDVSID